jgi:hypothetical protein
MQQSGRNKKRRGLENILAGQRYQSDASKKGSLPHDYKTGDAVYILRGVNQKRPKERIEGVVYSVTPKKLWVKYFFAGQWHLNNYYPERLERRES